ncbi:MAG TPA: hypothetical protein VGR48_15945 [Terriglobales bacterium]|nr:hypothetical protein [Terriglobales bacterium]
MKVSARSFVAVVFAACLCLFGAASGRAQVSVLTQHNDNARTGQNLQETTLNTSNVNVSNFGKLFSRAVDGYIYAQPLYVPSLTIGGKTRNVVFVATEHNSVYAFDADDPNASAALWQVGPSTLGTPITNDDICKTAGFGPCPYVDLQPEVGITSTPVIDNPPTTIYVVNRMKDSGGTNHFQLWALDLLTGAVKPPSPVEITTSGFNAFSQLQRPGLLLANGNIYVSFGSVGDFSTWHGYIMAYNATTLAQTGAVNITPTGNGGSFWAGGQGLAADSSGSIYGITSNGTFNGTGGQTTVPTECGSCIIKFGPALQELDYFTPFNQSFLNGKNQDLGSGGPVLVPSTGLLVGGGKDGLLRVVNTATGSMGGYNAATDTGVDVQDLKVTPANIMGAPVYWNSPTLGPVIYMWGPGFGSTPDQLKAWKLASSTTGFDTTPVSTATINSAMGSASSGTCTANCAGEANMAALAVSANGNQSGIVWASAPASGAGDADEASVPGTLYAFDASNLTHELWDSYKNKARDDFGLWAKFNPPTVANGKVYLGTFSGQLAVYGLNPSSTQGGSPTFVQVNSAAPVATVPNVQVPFQAAQTAGDLNIVVVGWNDTVAQIAKVSDSAGNSYTLAAPLKQTGSGIGGSALSQAIYYAPNVKSGSNTVTVTFSTGALDPDVRILEYSGIATSNPLDVSASNIGSASPSDSGPATTTVANELIVGANTVLTTTSGPGAGFTPRTITTDGDIAEDMIVNSTGSYSATAPLTSNGAWVMQMATFKAASGSTGGGSFTLSASGGQTVKAGSSANFTITVNGQSGFSGAVALSATCPPNIGINCSITPASANAGGQATLSVTTTGATASLFPLQNRKTLPLYGFFLPLPGIALAGMAGSRRRKLGLLAGMGLVVMALLLMAGCGGGSSGGGGSGTPPGTYSITVTGTAGSVSQTTTATLTVQ